jgi:hypothetical protein
MPSAAHARAARGQLPRGGLAEPGSPARDETHTFVKQAVIEYLRALVRRHPCRWYERMRNGKHHDIMQIPGVHIETLHNPVRYTYAQIERACAIAQMLNRGKLVLVEPPRR